jgi:hypothetical protein
MPEPRAAASAVRADAQQLVLFRNGYFLTMRESPGRVPGTTSHPAASSIVQPSPVMVVPEIFGGPGRVNTVPSGDTSTNAASSVPHGAVRR